MFISADAVLGLIQVRVYSLVQCTIGIKAGLEIVYESLTLS